jgi:hypothetical protein
MSRIICALQLPLQPNVRKGFASRYLALSFLNWQTVTPSSN